MKRLFLSFCLVVFSVTWHATFGQVVSPGEASLIAEKSFASIYIRTGIKGEPSVSQIAFKDSSQEHALYVFNDAKGGFIIMSAEKRAYPLLGWSDTTFDPEDPAGLPPSLVEMTESWINQIEFIREKNLPGSDDSDAMWEALEKGYDIIFSDSKGVAPLLFTKWNQGCGYNALCPVDSAGPCKRVVTGCVATAMAQVLRYNEHPSTGVGSKCYTHSVYGELCADFSSAFYDYDAMTNTSGNSHVALLMYHCGVAVSMNYGPSGSGAFSSAVATAMRNYFDYTNGLIVSKSGYAEENWLRLLIRELENNRPVYYSGQGTGGHAFVIDGYEETDHFHLNWGWGGAYNGYFYLSALNPGSMDFTSSQRAIMGMIPTGSFTGLDFSSVVDLSSGSIAQGDISTGTDNVNYYKNTYPATLGKELIYRVTTTLPGRIEVKITDETSSVYTFLLNHPHNDSLVIYGTNGLRADDMPSGTYYIVAEGFAGAEPTFNIEVVSPTSDSDLDIVTASVTPIYIEPLQTNVLLKSTVKNIGNSNAAACVMEYWLSEDASFDEGSDVYVGSGPIAALAKGESTIISSVVTIPAGIVPGNYYMIFVGDRENTVPETDDENRFSVYVTVPEPGIINCASAISLISGEWHRGNSLTDGTNLVEEYSAGRDMTGPEVIHTFTPAYNGMAEITFVEKSTGSLSAIVLPICNENTIEQILKFYNPLDTIISESLYVVAGNQYFIVVDGENGAAGEYGLKVDLPGECPDVTVQYWGSLDLCEGNPWPGFWTGWGYSSYQWYRDGVAIQGAVNSSLSVTSTGNYHVKVTENGCTTSSDTFTVRMDMPPDTAIIATDDSLKFCEGDHALLRLENSVLFPVNWALNDTLLAGETGNTLNAGRPGQYSLYTINGACMIRSDSTITVEVTGLPADIGDMLPVPSDSMEFFYPFTYDNNDVSGNNYSMVGWDYEPADDRFGNFWQARYLRGESQKFYSSNYRNIPEDFTLSMWFRTTTDSGGLIAAFVDNPWGFTKADAVLYMSDDGKLRFSISNNAAPVELASSSSYNNGQWHHVVLQHDEIMTLDINGGTERLTSAGSVVKEVFKGYWTFGGPDIPATVAAMPSSNHFNGTIDDLMCINEVNPDATPWLSNGRSLSILGPDPSSVCYPGTIEFELPFSQRGVEYRVWNRTLSSWAPLSAVGNGGPVTIGGSDAVIGINEFQVAVRDLLTGCELITDTLISYYVPVCTSLPESPVGNLLRVYPVPATEVLHFESLQIIEELKIIDSHGRVVIITRPADANAVTDVSNLPDGIYFYRVTTVDKLVVTGKVVIIGGRK
jgi:hypothetical protein